MSFRDKHKRWKWPTKIAFWGFVATCLGVLITILFFGIQYIADKRLAEKLDKLATSGTLIPANEPDPPHNCDIPAMAIRVFFGSNVGWFDHYERQDIIAIKHEPLLSLTVKDGKGYIFAKIYSEDGRIIAEIRDNEFKINPNNIFKIERPDDHEIQVFDQYNRMNLKVRFINKKSFLVEGIFIYPGNVLIIVMRNKIIAKNRPTYIRLCMGNAGGAFFRYTR